MNFTLDDRHRSIRRFVMNALGSPPWTVRTERQPVADEDRPVAIVEPATPAVTLRSRTSIPQGDVERQQTFSITLYPVIEATAAESRATAAAAAEALEQALVVGMVTTPDDDSPGVLLSGPEMLPVYDFAGVDVKGVTRAGPDEPYGWQRADDYPVRPVQDDEDPLRWTITCDLRVSWEQAGRTRRDVAEEPIVGDLVPVPPGSVDTPDGPVTTWPGGVSGTMRAALGTGTIE